MALVWRIKQWKLKTLSNQFKRYYLQIPGPCCSFNHTASASASASGTKLWVLDQPNQPLYYGSQFDFCNNVRFFASRVQAKRKPKPKPKPKAKEEEKDTNGPRLNEKITEEFVRLVVDEGHRVVSRREALERAKRLKLDLVEVQRTAKPPVCKLMDYTKERYKQQIKDKDRAKSKAGQNLKLSDCKEVRLSGKIEQKDLQMKADMARRLVECGYRVKCAALGTEDQDLQGLLLRFSALIEDVAIVESGPDKDKKGAHIMVRHVKFGPSKKGSGKKVSKDEAEKLSTSPLLATEDDILSASFEIPDKDLEKNKSTWSDFHATEDFDQVFDFSDDLNSIAESSTDERIKVASEAKFSAANDSSEFALPTSVLDSIKGNAVPSSRLEARFGTGSGAQDPMSLDPTLTNRRMQQRDSNFSPSIGKSKQVDETDASLFRNLTLPADEFPKQEPPCPSSPSSAPSRFGIFSSPKANYAPVNGSNKDGKPSNSARNHSLGQVSENRNLPKSNSNGSQRPGIDKDGKGSWGIFSRESSNVVSSRTSESRTDSQR